MFRRVIVLLLALFMLGGAACAESTDALYLLQSGEKALGTAVLYQDQHTLLTSLWALLGAEDDLCAVGAGGTLTVRESTLLADGLVQLTLEEASPAVPLQVSRGARMVYALGHNAEHQPVHKAAGYCSHFPYDETERIIYTALEALLPGSVLVDENGALYGVTLSVYGEGINRYVAMSAEDIKPLEQLPTLWVRDFSVLVGNAEAMVEWTKCDVSCGRDDCVLGVFYADSANPFFRYGQLGEWDVGLELSPGRTYRVWIQHAHQQLDFESRCPEDAVTTVELPPAKPFDMYEYADSAIYLSSVPASQAQDSSNTLLPPMESITHQSLADEQTAVFLQVSSSYAIEENRDVPLLVTLTTPENYLLDLRGGFTFDTALQDRDDWNVDITPLLSDYLRFNDTGEFAPGEYTLSYYLNGALGNSYSWTME